MKRNLYIGLMSGTSIDGVDGVLVDFGAEGQQTLEVLHHAHASFPGALRAELAALNRPAGVDELQRAALAGNGLARCYADVVNTLLSRFDLQPADVIAVGAHGQTVRHRPGELDGTGFTLQVNSPALLAELCGIDVIADFRSRDVAAGGQGAPLVPAFHRAAFGQPGRDTAVLNLGGIANLTLLRADGSTSGFDCGPANGLMDAWTEEHHGTPYDADGAWAATGHVDVALLSAMLSEPFFGVVPPKSTGRDLFNREWLQRHLDARAAAAAPVAGASPPAADVQATLAELTARSVTDALRIHLPTASELLVCGGGAMNGHLMKRLAALLPGVNVTASDPAGLPATQVEAAAFAWLAKAFVERRAGNVVDVTGARGPRVLGALYPA